MKIQLLGTGSILTENLSACSLIDDRIMLDCPNGSVKAMRRMGINPTQVDICLITHFHADHYFDIPFMLLEQGIRPIRTKDFVIIGPKSIFSQIDQLFMLAYPEDWAVIKKQSRLRVIEVNDDKTEINIEGYSITPYKVTHSVCESYGYIISNNDRSVGFTGDSSLCSGVEEIVQSSDLTIADMSFEKSTKSHMGLEDIEILIQRYGSLKRIVPTHMGDRVRRTFSEKYGTVPQDGDIIYI